MIGHDYDVRHFRFQRYPQDPRWLECSRGSDGLKRVVLGLLLVILLAILNG